MKSRLTVISVCMLCLLISCGGPYGDASLSGMVDDGHWEDIVSAYQDCKDSVRFYDVACLNLALAETGQLADRAFEYTQAGQYGLIPEWGQDPANGALLSRLYYSSGSIALAQRMAFETCVAADGAYDPAMLRMLVRTNIVFGAYDVAEKYISLLEIDKKDQWASMQRRFLRNNQAVESDPEYGMLRKCIPEDDFFVQTRGIDNDWKDIIKANPSYGKTIQYLGVYYLLACDFDSFRTMLDEFYGSDALPELPKSFQEAVCLMSETDYGYWKRMGVSRSIYKRYREFKSRLGSGLDMDGFSGTFWYYVMRANQ